MSKVIIELTNDEALVLFERLAQLEDKDEMPVEDHAEELVFWRVHGQLEKTLVEPLKPNYKELVDEAKKRLLAVE